MEASVVSIVRVDDVAESVERAVELAGGLGLNEGDVVVVKPNAKNQSPPGYGIVTDPRVVEACVGIALKEGAGKVKIAEGAAYPTGAYDTFAAFQTSGIMGMTHRGTLLSACLKNIGVGCATREEKKRLHRLGIDEGIVDVYSAVRPRFNVVDGIVALEGDGPNLPPGKAKRLGLIVAGKDGLAVDAVCARIMGIEPLKVKHLRLASERGLGVSDLERIEVKGESIDDVATRFELPSTFSDL